MNDDGQSTTVLPPLPASSERAMAWNVRDNFYGVRSRDFWGENQVTSHEVEDYKICKHYFEPKGQGVECKKCHIGFLGNIEVRKGKLYLKGEPISFNKSKK